MGRVFAAVLSGCLAFATGSAVVAAPPQGRAGEIDPARVWIQNRGGAEAVPVTIEAATPVAVQWTGMPSVTVAESAPVRQARQPWEYQALTIAPAQDLVTTLTAVGREGWEMTGMQMTSAAGTTIMLKRPR
jgi:hypothetical protein